MVTATRTRTEEERPNYSYGTQRSFIADEDEDEEDNNYGKVNYFSSSPYTAVKEDEEDDEPAFEIQKRYNTDEDDDEDEYETDVYKKNGYVLSKNGLLEVNRETTNSAPEKRVKLTPRMKIAICCYSIIVALLIGFAIYNAVAIGSASSALASSQIEVASQQEVINGLEEEYNYLGTNEIIKSKLSSDYVKLDGTNSVIIESPVLDEVETFDAPSNWFNSICEFLSSLF